MDSEKVPMEFHVDVADKDSSISIEVFHGRVKCKEHSPLLDRAGNLRSGLHPWPLTFVNVPDLKMYGSRPIIDAEGNPCYKLWGTVSIGVCRTSMYAKLELSGPGTTLEYDGIVILP